MYTIHCILHCEPLCMLCYTDVGFLHPPSTSSDGLAGMSGTLRHITQVCTVNQVTYLLVCLLRRLKESCSMHQHLLYLCIRHIEN
jgi:hypothetical protein